MLTEHKVTPIACSCGLKFDKYRDAVAHWWEHVHSGFTTYTRTVG